MSRTDALGGPAEVRGVQGLHTPDGAQAPAKAKAKARRKVQHWFVLEEIESARCVGGLVLIAYCGRAERCGLTSKFKVLPVVGGLMAESKPSDCKACVRSYEAYLRRESARRDRFKRLNGY